MRLESVVVLLALLACKHGPKGVSAGDVCYKLEAAGVATKCQVASRGDLGVIARAAREYVVFALPSTPGKTGQVLRFKDSYDYEEAMKGFEAAAFLVGPHRYGSSKVFIYVQLDKSAPADVGAKTSAVVSDL